MTFWPKSRFIPSLFAALLALALLTSAQAEVFTQTYETTESQDFKTIVDTMLGQGFSANPSGKIIDESLNVQIGVFSNLVSKAVPTFTNGVILSTGKISDGPSLQNESAAYDEWDEALNPPGEDCDPDIEEYYEESFRDPAGLILYLKPKNKTINIPYVMASEEFFMQWDDPADPSAPSYDDYQDSYDKFAIFLKEIPTDSEGHVIDDGSLMSPYTNLAHFAGGGDVNIASVNQHTNTEYFISNVVSNEYGELVFPTNDIALPMEFNGAINGTHNGLVAVAEGLDTNKTYKLKIVIADGGFVNTGNSILFLRTEGITSGADLKIDVTGSFALAAPGPATFTNTLSNIGPATADGVVVTNWLPEGVSVATAASEVGSVSSLQTMGTTNYFVWTVGDRFKSGSNAVMRIDCTLPAKGVYTNLAHVVTDTGDYDPGNDTDDHVVTVGSLPELTIDLISTNKCYGESMWLDPITYLAKIDGTNDTARLTGFTVAFTNTAGAVVDPAPTNAAAKVGKYYITLANLIYEPAGVFGDRVTINGGIFEVTNRCLTITASDTNKVYGTTIDLAQDAFKIAAGSLADGETITQVSITSKKGLAGNAKAPVDIYVDELKPDFPVTGMGGFDPNNYTISFSNGTLTVTKATLAVAAPNIVKVYDGEGTNVTAAIIGDQPLAGNVPTYLYSTTEDGPYVEWQNLQYTNVVFKEGLVSSHQVWYKVSTDPENYFAATNWAWVTITQRCVTVRANDATKKPGTPDPDPFAWSVVDPATSIVAGEETKVYMALTNDVKVFEKLDRTPDGETPGNHYTITTNAPFASFTTGVLANYALAFMPGKLTIEDQTPLTFYVASTNVVYGAEIPTGFRFDHTDPATYDPNMIPRLDEVTFGTDYAKGSAVGDYTIITNNDALASVYYAITVVPGTLTVTQRCVTVKSESATKVYDGTPLSTNEIKVIAGSFADGEGVEGYGFASITDVGTKENTFSVKPQEGTATDLGNYSIVSSNGTLEVTRAPILPVKPGEEPPTDPTKAWTRVENVIKCYDGLGTNIWPTSDNLVAGNEPTYRYGTCETGPFDREWKDLQFTNVVFDAYGNVTSNPVWYVVTTWNGAAANYFAATNSAYVMITQRCVTVTADNTNKVYGTEITFKGTEFTAVGLTNDETIASVSLTSEGTEKTAAVNEYAIEVKDQVFEKGLASNYQFTFNPGTLTVTKATLAVAAPNIVKVYDGAGTNVTAAIVGDQPLAGNVPTYLYSTTEDGPYVEWQNLQFTNVVFKEGAVSSNQVWYKVSTDPENYFAATNWAWVTITQRPLTVRADDAKKKPGADDPDPFAWHVEDAEQSIVAGEETSVYTALTNDVGVSEKLYRTPSGEAKGDYTITTNAPFAALTTGVLVNYALAFTPGTLTITDKDALTFYVASTNVAYGAEIPTGFSFDHTDPATYDSEKVTGLDTVQFKTTYCEKAPCSGSPYAITTNSVLSSVAYDITVVPGTLTVTPAPLTIVASNAVKVYGTALTLTGREFDPPFGLVDDETVTNVTLSCAEAADEGASVGDYTIALGAPLLGDHGFNEANYTLDPTNGMLTVTKARITPYVPGAATPPAAEKKSWTQAANIIKCYDGLGTNIAPTANLPWGDAPHYLFSTNEAGPFVAWQNLQFTNVVFDANGSISSNRVWYTVTTTKETANYENYFTATNYAYVVITQRCVTVTAQPQTKQYGAVVDLDGLTTGFTVAPALPNGESIVSVTRSCELAKDAAATVGDHAGAVALSHPVTGAGANFSTNNYNIAFSNATLTVTNAVLTITASDTNKVYGTTLSFAGTEFTVEGLQPGDSVTKVTLSSGGTAAGASCTEEGYAITAAEPVEGTGLANYTLVFKPGRLTVTKDRIATPGPGVTPPTEPTAPWTQAASIIKCYDGLGTNINPTANLPWADVASYLFSTNAAGPFVAWENLQFTNVVFDTDGNVTSNRVYYTITTDKAGVENYFAATNYAYVTITQRCVTIEVNDATWQVGKTKPMYGFSDFTSQLAAGDVVTDVTGGTESYSNKVWEAAVPTKADAGTYADEIWLRADSLTGAKKGNYQIEIVPGDLEIKGGEAKLVTTITATLNWDTGLEDFSMTVRNDGDGSVAAEDNYWVQLADGPAASGDKASVAKSYYLDSPTGQLAGGTNYVDLTTAVKTALKKAGNKDEVFDPGESITVGGVSVYHWKRWKPELFIDLNNFFVSGNLQAILLGDAVSSPRLVAVESNSSSDAEGTPRPQEAAILVDADVSSASEQDQTVLSPTPTLHSNSDANETFASTGAVVYDGILTLEGELAGTIRVNLGKANKKTGVSKLTATITPVGAKRVSVSGNFNTAGSSFTVKAKDVRELALELSADGISGTFGDYAIDGARNRYSSKTAVDKAVVADADQWIGTYTVACPVDAFVSNASGYDTFTVKITKKGRATIAGRLADGTTVSASAQMIIGTDGCCVPVVWSKKTVTRTFCVWFGHGKDAAPTVDADVSSASIEVIGLENAIISPVGNLAGESTFYLDGEPFATVAPNGKKWTVTSDAKLKLTFNAKTGMFTGSYRMVVGRKTTTVTVRGIVVDGVGYGTTAAKGLTALRVKIE